MSKASFIIILVTDISYLGAPVLAGVLCLKKYLFLGIYKAGFVAYLCTITNTKSTNMHNETMILIASAPRTTCNDLMTVSTDGDLRGLVQARINFLDNIQKEAQKIIYTQTPPGMVDSWELREWWFENFQTLNICDIDFHSISEGKKQEWYAFQNQVVETDL